MDLRFPAPSSDERSLPAKSIVEQPTSVLKPPGSDTLSSPLGNVSDRSTMTFVAPVYHPPVLPMTQQKEIEARSGISEPAHKPVAIISDAGKTQGTVVGPANGMGEDTSGLTAPANDASDHSNLSPKPPS